VKRDQLIFLGVLLAGAIVAVVIVLATGGDDESGGGATAEISTDLSTKPEIPVPDGAPPSQLEVNDLVEGDGATAKAGDNVSVQYVGVNYSDGQEFDTSWDDQQPFPFKLGAGSVIPGWDQGVAGMKVGGRRELIIPPDLAYGAQGRPPTIPPNETLIFVVDLVDVQPGR
jgi:peptidylprolyl isomerase